MPEHAMRFCSAAAGLLAAMLGCAGPVLASPRLISLVFNSSVQSTQQSIADGFRQRMLARRDTRIIVDERGGNAIGSEAAVLAATRAGAVDTSVLSGTVFSEVVPEFGVFNVPFLFRDPAHARMVAEGPVGAAIAAKSAEKGLVLLAIGKQGFRHMTNSKRPIRTPGDLKGLKIRLVPNEIDQMTFKALGADVVTMDFPLVYGALKDGRIDGQENPLISIVGTHFQDVQKYLSLTGHVFGLIVFIANREIFEQLAPADQAALRAAATESAAATWQDGEQLDVERLEQLRHGGMDIIEKVDRKAFIDALKPLDPEFERRFGKETLDLIRSTP
jgi:tripartite ATP-independent transporter DctP family solute receptor